MSFHFEELGVNSRKNQSDILNCFCLLNRYFLRERKTHHKTGEMIETILKEENMQF